MYNEISAYLGRGNYPFHMPGHKGNLAYDLTEIPGMDVLSDPQGIIKDLQCRIASFYGAGESFLLTNGASAGIVAAMCLFSEVLVPRRAHVSVYNGLVFSGAKPLYYLEEKFGDLPPNAVVFVTSPTYEGFTANIAEIAEKVHAGGGLLVVDEAHGAHFAFHEYFPKSALSQGADIVISSLHKTLPTMSGMAVLHVKKGAKVDIPRLKFFVNAMHTTSPSYFMMAQCGFALGKLWESPAIFDEYVSKLKNLRELLNPIPTDDPTKLLFRTAISAEKVAKILAEDYKIQAEMARGQDLLFMTSVADTDEGFERLVGAVRGIEKHLVPTEKYVPPACFSALPEIAVSPREAMLAQHETVPAEQAVGRISAELVVEYPPGIPLLVPGERVTAEHHLRQKTLGVIVEKKSALGL